MIELVSRPENDVAVRQVVRKLADARLLVTEKDTVEIIHDALITEWWELGKWIEQEGVFLLWRQRLGESLREWKVQKEQEGYLLNDAPLAEAEGYLQGRRDELNAEECRYIERSLKKRDRDRRRTIARLAGGLVAVSVFGGIATWQWQKAEHQSLINETENLANSALGQFETGKGELEALKQAIQAGQKLKTLVKDSQSLKDYPTVRPLLALQTILSNIREKNQFRGHEGQVTSVKVWNLSKQQKQNEVKIIKEFSHVETTSVSLDGNHLISVTKDSATIHELSGKPISELKIEPDEELDYPVHIWNKATGEYQGDRKFSVNSTREVVQRDYLRHR